MSDVKYRIFAYLYAFLFFLSRKKEAKKAMRRYFQ